MKTVTGDRNYERMARLLLAARTCHQKLGTREEFTTYLADLRAGQRRKRNLMKILDQHELWGEPALDAVERMPVVDLGIPGRFGEDLWKASRSPEAVLVSATGPRVPPPYRRGRAE